jgi:hypothetical protein
MRLTPGALLLRFRQKFGHGLCVAWYRDVVRPRILKTAPVEGLNDLTCEIHVLTSESDWLNLVWALKSFYRFSGRRYALCVHDDGTLSAGAQRQLRTHFPEARLIGRAEADERAREQLAAYPRCLAFRMSNPLAMKLFDFLAWLRSDRLLLIDSDVLFFAAPDALLARIEDPGYLKNSVNPDVTTAYTVSTADIRLLLGLEVPERFNSGLGLIHCGSMRLDWFEEFLGLPGIRGHHWQIEQTLFALCSARFGVELLPADYQVRLETSPNPDMCRHYVGRIRHLMYSEGMRKLMFLGSLGNYV